MSNDVDVVELIAQATMNRIIFLPENYYRRLIEQMKERNEVYSSNNPLGYQGIMCLGHHVCLIRDLEEGKEMSNKKQTRGCNLCAAHAKAAKKGTLKESFDCMSCLTSYKASKGKK